MLCIVNVSSTSFHKIALFFSLSADNGMDKLELYNGWCVCKQNSIFPHHFVFDIMQVLNYIDGKTCGKWKEKGIFFIWSITLILLWKAMSLEYPKSFIPPTSCISNNVIMIYAFNYSGECISHKGFCTIQFRVL